MVRFVLRNRSEGMSMKVEIGGDEEVSEIGGVASECWGGGFMLSSGYDLLRPEDRVGDRISDGDVIDVVPDPDLMTEVRRI